MTAFAFMVNAMGITQDMEFSQFISYGNSPHFITLLGSSGSYPAIRSVDQEASRNLTVRGSLPLYTKGDYLKKIQIDWYFFFLLNIL